VLSAFAKDRKFRLKFQYAYIIMGKKAMSDGRNTVYDCNLCEG